MEAKKETPPKPFLAQMDLLRGEGTSLIVRICPPAEQGNERFNVEDLKGNPVTLTPDEQMLAETLLFGKPEARTLHRLELPRKGIGRRKT